METKSTPRTDRAHAEESDSRAVVRNVTAGVLGAALWVSFTTIHVLTFIQTGRVVGIGLAATELLTAALFVVRRTPMATSTRPSDWAVALVGSFGSLLARPGGEHSAASDAVGLALQAVGVVVVALVLLAMGRSFGVVAANRGIVTSGPYRVVRHPLYAAYLIEQSGYLLQSFRLWNIALFLVVWACQIARIRAEERVLDGDPTYRVFRDSTRARLVPGLW